MKIWWAALLLVACTSAEEPGDEATLDDETGGELDDLPMGTWEVRTLHADGARFSRVVHTADGTRYAAFFGQTPIEDGICDEIDVDPPAKRRVPIYLATLGASPEVVEVARPVVALDPTGLDLALDGSDAPWLAFTGGDPEGQYCGAGDAVIQPGLGTVADEVVAATESDDAFADDQASDAGFVVGQWPALVFDGDDALVAYRDVHFGALQRDDQARADAELARENGGGFDHEVVDLGQGGGVFSRMVLDADGSVVIAHVVPVDAVAESRKGLWVTRETSEGWERVRILEGDVPFVPSLLLRSDGALVVGSYVPSEQRAKVWTLPSGSDLTDATAWQTQPVGIATHDEGRYIALAEDPDGKLVAAYHRCRRVTDVGDGCVGQDEALVLAREGAAWSYQSIDTAPACGEHPSIAVQADGALDIVYRCATGTSQARTFEAKHARWTP